MKSGWWRQVFAADLRGRLPRLALIDSFEWDTFEQEVNGRVDWTVSRDPVLRRAFRHALPAWLRYGVPRC